MLNQSILPKIFFFLLFIVVSSATQLKAQETFQEIYEKYLRGETTRIHTIEHMMEHLEHDHSEHDFIKCLTPLMILVENERQESSFSNPLFLKTAPAKKDFSVNEFVSPSGKFQIHYATSGRHQVPLDDLNGNTIPDYVEEVAEAADYSYNQEILTLGYSDPIDEGEMYDVYIEDLSNFGAYGLTNNSTVGSFPCDISGSETCIYIENDFEGFPENTDPEGRVIGSIKVTMAHEFKHSIQYAQNNWRGNSDLWAEMDATLMEEVVYDDVNDYYNYIGGFSTDLFSSPSSSLTAGSYEDITWALYFHERFGDDFWPSMWDIIEENNQTSLIEAIETELQSRSESYHEAVLESYLWHMASGSNLANINYGFDEAFEYPNPNISQFFSKLQTEPITETFLQPFSARYYLTSPEDITPNGFLKLDFNSNTEDIHFGFLGYQKDGNLETYSVLGNPNRLNGTIETTWEWENLDKVGLVVMNSNPTSNGNYSFQITEYFIEQQIQLAQNFPNPFNPQTTIRLSIPQTQAVKLDVYDILGRHIQTIYEGNVNAGFKDFTFDASSLSSGIYIYQLESNSGIQKKAMTLIK